MTRQKIKQITGINGIRATATISHQDTPLRKRREVSKQKSCTINKQNIAEDNRGIFGHILVQTITMAQTTMTTTTTTTKTAIIATSTHTTTSTKIHGTLLEVKDGTLLQRKETPKPNAKTHGATSRLN